MLASSGIGVWRRAAISSKIRGCYCPPHDEETSNCLSTTPDASSAYVSSRGCSHLLLPSNVLDFPVLAGATLEAEPAGNASSLAARAGTAWGLVGATRVHRGAGDRVAGHLGVDVDLDTRMRRRVSAREADGGRAGAASARDAELEASNIGLSTAHRAGGVESNDLSTKEVVAGRDIGWDFDVHTTAASVEVLDAPEVVVATPAAGVLPPTVVEDLEPGGGAVGGSRVADPREVDEDGAVVVAADAVTTAATIAGLLWECSYQWASVPSEEGV